MLEFKAYASGSRGNLYTVSDGKSKLLLECGVTFKEIQHALNFRVSELAGCLLSHGHADHSRSVEDVMKAGIDVYTSQGTIDTLGLSGHRVHAVQAEKQFQIAGWRVMPLEAQHDFPESLAFLVANDKMERLLFAIDTAYLKNRFVSLNIIAVECNYSIGILRTNADAGTVEVCLKNRIVKSHFSLENLKELLLANDLSKVREIWLLHLSDGNSDEKRFKREIMCLTGKPTFICKERGQL